MTHLVVNFVSAKSVLQPMDFTCDIWVSPEDQGWSHNGRLQEGEFFGCSHVDTGFLNGQKDVDISRTSLVGCWLSQPPGSPIMGCFFIVLTLHVTLLLLGWTSHQVALAEACVALGLEINSSDLAGM